MSEYVRPMETIGSCAAVITADLEFAATLLRSAGWTVVEPEVLQRTTTPTCEECEAEMHPWAFGEEAAYACHECGWYTDIGC